MSLKKFKNDVSYKLLAIQAFLFLITASSFYMAMWTMPLFVWLIVLGVVLICIILFIVFEHPIFTIIGSLFGLGCIIPIIILGIYSHLYEGIANVSTFLYGWILPLVCAISWIGLIVYCIIILIRD